MAALVLDAEQKTAHLKSVPVPIPSSEELLVQVHYVALNPVDSLYTYNPLGSTGRIIGSDFAGTVRSLGTLASSLSDLRVGDRVAGFLQGACSINDRPGAFAQYLRVPWDLVWKVPAGLPLEAASSISLCGLTAAQALFYRWDLGAPFNWGNQTADKESRADSFSIVIYGASTSVGLYAAQLVRRGAEANKTKVQLIGVASEKHFSMLKKEPYSYDHLVDYRQGDWPERVRDYLGGEGADYGYDCISEGTTVLKTGKTVKPNGGMAVVRSREGGAWSVPREDLPSEPVYGAVWEGLGEDVQYMGMVLPASPQARSFTVAFYRWISDGGRLQPNRVRMMPGGLERIVDDGFKLLGSGTMEQRGTSETEPWMKPLSGEKLVYSIDN
ncbi:GroES-like protein [Xylaria palmicola]|nr:GroES-like protein [Xylaria palmicola]